jgi:hypothetical protein
MQLFVIHISNGFVLSVHDCACSKNHCGKPGDPGFFVFGNRDHIFILNGPMTDYLPERDMYQNTLNIFRSRDVPTSRLFSFASEEFGKRREHSFTLPGVLHKEPHVALFSRFCFNLHFDKVFHREQQQYAPGHHLGYASHSQVTLSSSHLISTPADHEIDVRRASPAGSHQNHLAVMDAMELDPQQLSPLTPMDAQELSFRVDAMQLVQESTKKQYDRRKWNSFNRQERDGRRVMKNIYEAPKSRIRIFPHRLFLSDIGFPFTAESLEKVLSAYGLDYSVQKKTKQWAEEGRQAVREMLRKMGELSVIEEMEE